MLNPQKMGTILIWLGVAAWLPFLYLLAAGQNPSIYPYLIVHLIGIIGGTRLKALAKKDKTPKKRHKRQVIGKINDPSGCIGLDTLSLPKRCASPDDRDPTLLNGASIGCTGWHRAAG